MCRPIYRISLNSKYIFHLLFLISHTGRALHKVSYKVFFNNFELLTEFSPFPFPFPFS